MSKESAVVKSSNRKSSNKISSNIKILKSGNDKLDNSTKVHLIAFVTIIFWAISLPFSKMALVDLDPLPLAGVRYLGASIFLLFLLPKMRKPEIKDLGWFFLSGCAGFSVYMVFFNTGVSTLTSATTSVLLGISPASTALLAQYFYKETLKTYQWVAMTICFTGVAVLTVLEHGFEGGSGIFWMLAAVACISFYNILQRKITKTYTAMEATTYSIFMSMLILGFFVPEGVKQLVDAPMIQWFNVLYLSLGASVCGYMLWSKALSMTKNTSTVTNYMFLNPFMSTIAGFLILHETITQGTLTGGLIILFGLAIFNFGGKIFKH